MTLYSVVVLEEKLFPPLLNQDLTPELGHPPPKQQHGAIFFEQMRLGGKPKSPNKRRT
jgi:hypothetical protein